MARKTKQQRPFGAPSIGSRPLDKGSTPEAQPDERPGSNPVSNEPSARKLAEANSLMQAGKFDEADQVLQAILTQGPDEQAYAGRLNIAQRAKRWEDGVRLAETAVAAFPGSILLGRLHGQMLLDAGHVDDAEEVYRALVNRFPNHYVGFAGLATVASRRKEWSLAAERWKGCREQFPNETSPAPAWWSASEAYSRYALGQLDDAETLFQIAAAELPKQSPFFASLARLAAKRGDWDPAVRRWEDCLQRFPDHTDVQTWRNEMNHILNRRVAG
jgi:predicted Zn-dependent protease